MMMHSLYLTDSTFVHGADDWEAVYTALCGAERCALHAALYAGSRRSRVTRNNAWRGDLERVGEEDIERVKGGSRVRWR